jgi:hypothetical protein
VNVRVALDEVGGRVRAVFSRPVGYLSLTPEEAERMGHLLLEKAALLRGPIGSRIR